MTRLRYAAPIFVFLFAFFLSSCDAEKIPDDVVARVNGEDIRLRSLRSVIELRRATVGFDAAPTIDDLRKNYADALTTLIANALARQELAKNNIEVDDKAYAKIIDAAKDEYGPEEFQKYLDEALIREEEWIELTRDSIGMEIFKNNVLLPSIKITAAEIKDYYQANKNAFSLPETYNICVVSASAREDVDAWCARLEQGVIEENEIAQCLWLGHADLPEMGSVKIQNLKRDLCAAPEQENGAWRTVALIGAKPAKSVSLAAAYPLIENILLDQKKQEAFDKWVEEKIKTSRILVSPVLNESLTQTAKNLEKE